MTGCIYIIDGIGNEAHYNYPFCCRKDYSKQAVEPPQEGEVDNLFDGASNYVACYDYKYKNKDE